MTVPIERVSRWAGGDILLLVVAIILSVIVAALFAFSAIVSIGTAREADARICASFELADLREGDCVSELPQYVPTDFTVVDCAQPHAAEFVFFVDQTEAVDSNLGDRALAALADAYCDTTFTYRINISADVDDLPNAAVNGYVGSRATFAGGTRFQCFLFNTTGEPLVGAYYLDDGV
ncbi:hypothetical protein [Pseudolysinimonas sp.]|uniref:hypothetical protein n=1 Tax=Pseudolysinimonas sp. TaxID=2680009 RepID=UPI00286A2347|nr:hypothetical protein [Pseudolysinimonas sp.]